MVGRVFISYRQQPLDSEVATLIREGLDKSFKGITVFRDVDSLRGADLWKLEIDDRIAAADAIIAVVGPGWVQTFNERKTAGADDWVLYELSTSIQQGKPIIPVLVGGETKPIWSDLPESIRQVGRRHAVVLRSGKVAEDMPLVVTALRPLFKSTNRTSWSVVALSLVMGAVVGCAVGPHFIQRAISPDYVPWLQNLAVLDANSRANEAERVSRNAQNSLAISEKSKQEWQDKAADSQKAAATARANEDRIRSQLETILAAQSQIENLIERLNVIAKQSSSLTEDAAKTTKSIRDISTQLGLRKRD